MRRSLKTLLVLGLAGCLAWFAAPKTISQSTLDTMDRIAIGLAFHGLAIVRNLRQNTAPAIAAFVNSHWVAITFAGIGLIATLFLRRQAVRLLAMAAYAIFQLFRTPPVRVRNIRSVAVSTLGTHDYSAIVYPDTRQLRVELGLEIASGLVDDIPLRVVLRGSDGIVCKEVRELLPASPPGARSLVVDLLTVETGLPASGPCLIEVSLDPSPIVIGRALLRVVNLRDFADDLELVDLRLLAATPEGVVPAGYVFADAESVIPLATIRARNLDPNRFGPVTARIELVSPDGGGSNVACEANLDFRNGIARLDTLECPIAGTDRIAQTGRWELRLSVAGRGLGAAGFTLVSGAEAMANLRIVRFDILGIDSGGKVEPLGDLVSRLAFSAVIPVAEIFNPFPSAEARYHIKVVAMQGEQIIGHVEGQMPLQQRSNRMLGGELAITRGGFEGTCSFYLLIDDVCVAEKRIRIVAVAPQVADVQGRLRAVAGNNDAEFQALAERLVQQAAVGG